MPIGMDDRNIPAYADKAADGSVTKTTISGTSSAALASGAAARTPKVVRMVCDVTCYITTGTHAAVGAATTSDFPIIANLPAYIYFDGDVAASFRVIGTSGSLWWGIVA